MPGLDGTGPQGGGPMTGRGMGYCIGYVNPTYLGIGGGIRGGVGRGYVPGRGFGRGFGQGSMYNPRGILRPRFVGSAVLPWGYAENPYQPPPREQELATLNSYKKEIETQLGGIEKRIKELDN
ncbi:MAG: hypothetical protein DRP55_07905 [Spirochaetes bacterium]|nr:MAG: hypothetical protein DRP55_07905 [Spirochaetota bacterium]